MNILVDHNLRGHAVALAGSLAASGWLELIEIQFILFEDVGLPIDSDDRVVEENTPTSLPVLTIGTLDRLLTEPLYRERCVNRLVDIIVDLDDYRGSRRIFIP